MILDKLDALLTEETLDEFQLELNKSKMNEDLYSRFKDGETLFHRVVKKKISESIKIKFIFKLSDSEIDINAQNSTCSQTCLHLAVIHGLSELVFCLLKNGADLTITDREGLCAYNRARRLSDQVLSKKIITKMQSFYPTYWIGIDSSDMNIIRRLVNSWCRFKVKKKGKLLIDYAKEKNFRDAYELFRSLEVTMDLCSAVLAENFEKVEQLVENNSSDIKLNFKNMKENNATVLYYAITQNNPKILKTILRLKPYILNEFLTDDLDIDYPLYFAALKSNAYEECLNVLTPCVQNLKSNQNDISSLFYKGMSFLRYALENKLDYKLIENLLSSVYCSRELITVKDPNFLTPKEYASKMNQNDYVEMIDRVTADYVINNKKLRMDLALNGYDFNSNKLIYKEESLLDYSNNCNLTEVKLFLKNVDWYQEKIKEFHNAVEKNDYFKAKALFTCNFDDKPELDGIFYSNLISSRLKNESQTVLFKAVLNGYYEILNLLLDMTLNDSQRVFNKLDDMRDHCFRTPMHYACGYNDNRRMSQLLSQFGFSENVFDKDGMTPLDFQERINSEELQELISINRGKKFNIEEPNPWSWKVWTRIQREKNTLKQIMSFNNSKSNHHGHGHSHNHQNFQTQHQHTSASICSEEQNDQDSYCNIS